MMPDTEKTPETEKPEIEAIEGEDSEAEAAPAEAAPAEAPPTPEEQIADLNDRLLRALAELENTRRRTERERIEALKYGGMALARDMLGAVDNLQRALKAINEVPENQRGEALNVLLEGVVATERDLLAGLGRHKVTPIEPMGEKFDPNLHEAIFEAPDTGQPAGTVIEVVETGYMMDERLLRPAKVGIAKDKN